MKKKRKNSIGSYVFLIMGAITVIIGLIRDNSLIHSDAVIFGMMMLIFSIVLQNSYELKQLNKKKSKDEK